MPHSQEEPCKRKQEDFGNIKVPSESSMLRHFGYDEKLNHLLQFKKRVNDVCRGIVVMAKERTYFHLIDNVARKDGKFQDNDVALDQYNEECLSILLKTLKLKSRYAKCLQAESVVLLLESPHKDEYDYAGEDVPRSLTPANGETGTQMLSKSKKSKDPKNNLKLLLCFLREHFEFINGVFPLIICNPIQFQASLHWISSDGGEGSGQDSIWKFLWNIKQDEKSPVRIDFIRRLNNYKPRLIINCCTGPADQKDTPKRAVEKEIKNELKSFELPFDTFYAEASHPCSWTRHHGRKFNITNLCKYDCKEAKWV